MPVLDTKTIDWLTVYRSIRTAREIDAQEQQLISSGCAFFHVSGAGHESTAILAPFLTNDDWLHLHYRDKALMLARGMPVSEFFRSLMGCRDSHSRGRQMSAHMSCPKSNIMSLVGPVGNNSLQCCGVAAAIKDSGANGIVVCSVGDGTTQEGEYLEAIAEAVRWQLPVLFLIADNGYSISNPTGKSTFFDLPSGPADKFYGLPIIRANGRDVVSTEPLVQRTVHRVREFQQPRLLLIEVERLDNHTNADDQAQYREWTNLQNIKQDGDPLLHLRTRLRESGIAESELEDIDREICTEVRMAVERVLKEDDPTTATTAVAPYPPQMLSRSEYRGEQAKSQLTMREAICQTLLHHLETDSRVHLYGQDIEDPKGDVFGVTKGLSSTFPGRVVNAPLSESTIVGTAIGRALAGQRPVAFIQFADFLPLAFNQIASELASMYWRTDGAWNCPVILMVSCGGYRPGLGPFHAQTMEGLAAHIPGVDVVMPSSAADAAGLLNAAFQSPRPTIFLYPKSCLNLEDRATSTDVPLQFVQPGRARRLREGRDLTLVTWGNTVRQSEAAAEALEEHGFTIDLLDLRSVSPWDSEMVVASVAHTGRLVVVHEDNLSGGFGAEIVATVVENVDRRVLSRRVARPDTFVPFHYGNQLDILPSVKRILESCAELLECDVAWEVVEDDPPGEHVIRAIGSGPSDEMVEIVEFFVDVGDQVKPGQLVAEVEAIKSTVEIAATVTGFVTEVCGRAGGRIEVGRPLLRMSVDEAETIRRGTFSNESPGTPRLNRRRNGSAIHTSHSLIDSEQVVNETRAIYGSRPASVTGNTVVTSESIAEGVSDWTGAMAVKRTGVEKRNWASSEQSPASMALEAAERLLSGVGRDAPPIGAVLCSVTGPQEASPSISCQVAGRLRDRSALSRDYFAFDFNAACSGYVYGLRLARDILRGCPDSSVLLLTAEVASPMLNPVDPMTAFLFGDAATATLIASVPSSDHPLQIKAPVCFAEPDPEMAIHLPCVGSGDYLTMDGIAVARAANKAMSQAVRRALDEAKISADALGALVPHPGSGRILKLVAEALNIPASKVLTTLASTGNTSSSSIPLALDVLWNKLPKNQPVALTAFGAGFTAAAAIATYGDTHA